jgi:hypothetical protein
MKRILADIPRPVLISIAVMAVVLALFGVLTPVLGGARDGSFAENRRLQDDINRAKRDFVQVGTDADFVKENQLKFEELLQNGRLVPHTRRAAVVVLNEVAKANGLTALEYSFAAATAASPSAALSQPDNKAFRVSVEDIELRVGAPTDGPIYRFIAAIDKSFPGSVVLQSLTLSRAPTVTSGALALLSEGKDPKLVEGVLRVSWRTAQAQDEGAAK